MRLVKLHRSGDDGACVWVNPDRVLYVEPSATGGSVITFGAELEGRVYVRETPKELGGLFLDPLV